MDRTLDTPEQRIDELLAEVVRLTGEDKVMALCTALEQRLEQLQYIGQRLRGVDPGTRR